MVRARIAGEGHISGAAQTPGTSSASAGVQRGTRGYHRELRYHRPGHEKLEPQRSLLLLIAVSQGKQHSEESLRPPGHCSDGIEGPTLYIDRNHQSPHHVLGCEVCPQ